MQRKIDLEPELEVLRMIARHLTKESILMRGFLDVYSKDILDIIEKINNKIKVK